MNTTSKRKYRIKSRTRFTIFIVMVVLLIGTVFTTILGLNNAESLTEQQYIQVQVEPGDTLWSIATEYMSDSTDIRQSVYKICNTNDTSASELYPGQVLSIPVEV